MADTASIYCPACQQRTSLIRRTYYSGHDGYTYEISECNACPQHFLIKRDGAYSIVEVQPKALPRPVDQAIPSPIREDIEEAQKCFAAGAWRASATMARRAIQNICLEKEAPATKTITTKTGNQKTVRNELKNQIDWLYNQRIITQELRDWAHEIRSVGNDGAHPGDAEDTHPVSEQDARDILDLVDAFCSPLYIAAAVYNRRKQNATPPPP